MKLIANICDVLGTGKSGRKISGSGEGVGSECGRCSQTGMASTNDLLKAQVKENEAELLVSKATNGLALSSMNLCRVSE